MLVIGSVTDVEVESVPVVIFGPDPVFGARGASGCGLWRGVSDSMFGASLVPLGLFGLDSDASEFFGAGAGLLNGALAGVVGGALPSVHTLLVMVNGSEMGSRLMFSTKIGIPPSVSPWITDAVWESGVASELLF